MRYEKEMTSTRVRLWTVEEYHRMAETGILNPEERVELIEGQIVPMSPKNPPHSAITQRTNNYLKTLLEGLAMIRVQEPIHLDRHSEPEPDIAVVQIHPDDYDDHHPEPAEVFLVIEVADSTLKYDLENKAALYAKAQIAEYWVIDVNNQRVFVKRNPEGKAYQQETVLQEDATTSLLAFPDVTVSIKRFFHR